MKTIGRNFTGFYLSNVFAPLKSFVFLGIALSGIMYGCKSPSDTTPSQPISFILDGVAVQLDTTLSSFDTSIYDGSVGTAVELLNINSTVLTNAAWYYRFDSVKLPDVTLSFSRGGFAPVTVFHAQNGSPTISIAPLAVCNVELVPSSWLSVTIDSFYPNIDTSINSKRVGVQTDGHGDTTNFGTLISDTSIAPSGLYTIAHIQSMRPDKPSLGYIQLYISTNPGIDPANPITYDMAVSNFIPTPKDSTVKFVLSQYVGQFYNANLESGTRVFCKAYAYPYPHAPYYLDVTGKKYIFPGLGEYSANTMTFTIP